MYLATRFVQTMSSQRETLARLLRIHNTNVTTANIPDEMAAQLIIEFEQTQLITEFEQTALVSTVLTAIDKYFADQAKEEYKRMIALDRTSPQFINWQSGMIKCDCTSSIRKHMKTVVSSDVATLIDGYTTMSTSEIIRDIESKLHVPYFTTTCFGFTDEGNAFTGYFTETHDGLIFRMAARSITCEVSAFGIERYVTIKPIYEGAYCYRFQQAEPSDFIKTSQELTSGKIDGRVAACLRIVIKILDIYNYHVL